jgi:uroporphyrinogen decarboxylase
MERTMTAIGHKEPDRVPLFLLLSLYGAKELQIPIKEYFSKPELVAKAQLAMKEKYRNDCLYSLFYAPIEIEAFGGEVIFADDGPPNSGEPFLKSFEQITQLEIPEVKEIKCLQRVLEATELMKKSVGDETPIIGVVLSPFSLPIMQMGFEKYLELLLFREKEFEQLMRINEEFCVSWANAQLEAGATAICYFDPMASPTMVERTRYLATGHRIAKRTLARIKGPTATHLASGITLPVVDDIAETGTALLGFSDKDDLVALKEATRDKLCLIGNFNGIAMPNWTTKDVEANVKNVIGKAGNGGGLILSDNHGEIPWQVPEEVLHEIAEAVGRFGTYPLRTEK